MKRYEVTNDYIFKKIFGKEGIKEGIQKGEKLGLEKGKKEEKVEIAKKLKKMNMSIEEIEQATGLTKEEIEKL